MLYLTVRYLPSFPSDFCPFIFLPLLLLYPFSLSAVLQAEIREMYEIDDRNRIRNSNRDEGAEGDGDLCYDADSYSNRDNCEENCNDNDSQARRDRSESKLYNSTVPDCFYRRAMTDSMPLATNPLALTTAISALRFAIRHPLTNYSEVRTVQFATVQSTQAY